MSVSRIFPCERKFRPAEKRNRVYAKTRLQKLKPKLIKKKNMKAKIIKKVAAIAGLLLLGAESALPITLGPFIFNDSQFGTTLAESDGGTFRNRNWLNIVDANPGNPGALTGANFDTGIANIGLFGQPVYTIGYNTAIANRTGFDLGIVSARLSTNDTFRLEVSTDGINFTGPIDFGPALARNTGVDKSYIYGATGNGVRARLFLTPVDLSAFGVASGDTIAAVRVTSFPEGDLIRIAGLVSTVPDAGSTLTLLGSSLALLAGLRRWFIQA